ncbi:hypothetical protein F4805DRAFT_476963 [Annulohypoxylon moriforme]|nr:hypothetical protein F4805DRAFT_476963 [Annulohypoxylon moriforme]
MVKGPEARARRAARRRFRRNKKRLAALQSNWEKYATDHSLLTFGNCTEKNVQILFKGVPALSQGVRPSQIGGNHDQRSIMDKNSLPFGHPGPQDPRFSTLIHETQDTCHTSNIHCRTLQDVLEDYPWAKFRGLDTPALTQAVDCIFSITNEAALKWVRRWCPYMNLSRVFALNAASYTIPEEALETKFMFKSLPQLYADCVAAISVHGKNPQPQDVTLVADPCIIICRVFKDEETANLICKLKSLIQWLNIGLGCKSTQLMGEASRQIYLGEKAEYEIVNSLWCAYNVHRAEYSIRLVKQLKVLVESVWPSDMADSDYVLYPGESDTDSDSGYSGSSSEDLDVFLYDTDVDNEVEEAGDEPKDTEMIIIPDDSD